MSAAWGESGAVDEGEHHVAGEVDLGNGSKLVFNPAAFKRLLHSAHAVHAITKRANEICEAANGMVGLDARTVERLGDGQPLYKVEVENDPSTTRARARVLPNNFAGALDQAHFLTLLKSQDAHPSDPRGRGEA
jgi:hypothetical protein